MYRTLVGTFGHDDGVNGPIIAQSERLGIPVPDILRPKYTLKERLNAEQHFDGMTRLLDKRLHEISRDDRTVLDIVHRIRRDAFHRGLLRPEILGPVCILLFQRVVGLTRKLNPRHLSYSSLTDEQKSFLERFHVEAASSLIHDETVEQIGNQLLEGVTLDNAEFSRVLADDLLSRIDEALETLKDIRETDDEQSLDRLLNDKQFYVEKKAEVETCPDRDAIEQLFEDWRRGGAPRLSYRRIKSLRRRAERIQQQTDAANALGLYWSVEGLFSPAEERIGEIATDYDDWINLQIDMARGK